MLKEEIYFFKIKLRIYPIEMKLVMKIQTNKVLELEVDSHF